MSGNINVTQPSVVLASQAESWDDDRDFDWSGTPASAIELLSASDASLPKSAGGRDRKGIDKVEIPQHTQFVNDDDDIEDGFDDLDDEEVDTLKVSDLNHEILAQLAAHAKKSSSLSKSGLAQLSDAALPPLVRRLDSTPMSPTQKIEFDKDWDEDLEIPDSLSISSLKPRFASFQSDGEFEAPSVASTSGSSTSESHRSSSGLLAMPSHQRHVRGLNRPPHSFSDTSAQFPLATGHHQDKVKESEAVESDFVLSDTLQKLHLGPQVVRQPSGDLSDITMQRQRSALWSSEGGGDELLSASRERTHKTDSSTSSAKSSEDYRREELEEEQFDDLDFSSITPATITSSARPVNNAPMSMADRLRARLDARKSTGQNETGTSSQEGSVLDTDSVSGLIITDDMDLSPSRLRARNLSDRLREAAQHRRRHHNLKRKIIVGERKCDGDGESSAGAAMRVGTRYPSQGGSRSLESRVRFPSVRHATNATDASLRNASSQPQIGSFLASIQVSDKEGRRAPSTTIGSATSTTFGGNEARQIELRPQTPVLMSNVPSGRRTPVSRVTPQQAGVMPYALPTVSSLARQSPTNLRREADHHETTAARVPISPSSSSGLIPTAPKFMRRPRHVRHYGDGGELDEFENLSANDLQRHGPSHRSDKTGKQNAPLPHQRNQESGSMRVAPSNSTSTSDQSVSLRTTSKKGGRSRRKKGPSLIRNLGGAAKSSQMVGEMRWNPTLKCWEGNEKEGREFEVAIRSTGRPALIAPFAMNASSMDSSMPLSPTSPLPLSVSRSMSSAMLSPGLKSPMVGPRIVGDMLFDPIKMCWVRQDGEEEPDPFDAQDDDDDGDGDEQGKREMPLLDSHYQRLIRQRSLSAELMPASVHALQKKVSTGSVDVSRGRGETGTSICSASALSLTDSEHLIGKAVADAASQVPAALRSIIPAPVWHATLKAQQRHQREMAGFLPCATQLAVSPHPPTRNAGQQAISLAPSTRTVVRPATTVRRGRADASEHIRAASMGHLYFIQALARHSDRSL